MTQVRSLIVTEDGERVTTLNPLPVTVRSTTQTGIAPRVSNVSVATILTAFPTTAVTTVRGETAVRNGGSVTITLKNSDGLGVFDLLPKDTIIYPAGGPATLGYASVTTGTADLQILEMSR